MGIVNEAQNIHIASISLKMSTQLVISANTISYSYVAIRKRKLFSIKNLINQGNSVIPSAKFFIFSNIEVG